MTEARKTHSTTAGNKTSAHGTELEAAARAVANSVSRDDDWEAVRASDLARLRYEITRIDRRRDQ